MHDRRRSLLLALALAALTLAAYAPGFDNDFINYDDDLYITERPEVRAGLTPEGVAWAFTSFQGANWFPLTRLSWMLDVQLFGVNARASHAVSLSLHVLGALLLFAALRRLTGAAGPSAFAAGVFALHPLHVESVAWAASRKDVLAGIFFALALLAHERRARSPRGGLWAVLLLGILALGLMAKPVLVTLPFVLLLLDEWPLGRLRSAPGGPLDFRRLFRAVAEKIPLFLLVAGASVLTLEAQQSGGALQTAKRYPPGLRLANAFDALLVYLEKAFWPNGLSVFYPYPYGGVPAGRVVLGALVLVGVSALVMRRLPRRPYLAVGWFWFLGMLLPVSGVLQVGQAALADRYTYLPLTGLAIMLAWGAADLGAQRPALAALFRRVGVMALLVLAWITSLQIGLWRDSRTLFEHALAVTARNHVAHTNLGLALARGGRLEEAEGHLTEAIAIAPRSAVAHGVRGEVRLARDLPQPAAADFRSALRIETGSARWHTGLGRSLAEDGQSEAAERELRRAIQLDAGYAPAHALLGGVLLQTGRAEQAEASYRRALALEPALRRSLGRSGLAVTRAQLAAALAARGDPAGALPELDEAIRLDPREPDLRERRAVLLQSLDREAEAIAAYRETLRLRADSPRALNNLAWLLATSDDPALRDPGEAVRLAQQAVRLTRGEDPSVLDTLAAAHAAANRRSVALNTARRALALAEAQGDRALARSIRRHIADIEAGVR